MEERDGQAAHDYRMKWFDIVIEEYNSLRNESSDALKHQQSIINYGLTAIGVLIAFSANLWGNEAIVEVIFVLFIPFLCNLIILIWNGEVRRMSRAGQYIKRIEDKILAEFSGKLSNDVPALEWETYLRRPKLLEEPPARQLNRIQKAVNRIENFILFLLQKGEDNNNKIKSNYIAIIFMFGGLSLFSVLLGFGHNFSMFKGEFGSGAEGLWKMWLSTELGTKLLYLLSLFLNFIFFVYHYRYFQKVKK